MKTENLRMFLWDSELMRDYYLGQIIVLAKDIEEARNRVREYFRKDEHKLSEDEFDILEEDISKEAKVYDKSAVIEITGGS